MQTGQIPYQATGVACMAVFAGSGSRVLVAIGGDDGVVRVWDPATGEEIRQMIGHDGPVRSMIAFAGPHGRALIASGGGDGTMRVWDPATGIRPGELANRAGGVTSLTTFPGLDGHDYIVSGGRDGKVRVWDSLTGTQAGVITRDHSSSAVLVVKAYRGPFGGSHLAVGDRSQISRVYDIDTHTLIHSFLHELPGVDDMTPFVDDEWGGILLAVTEGHDIGIWSSYQIRCLTGHSGNVYAIEEFAGPDGRRWLASGSYDTTVRIWDPVSGNQIHHLTGHTDSVTALDEFTGPDSQVRLASCSDDKTVRIWDPHTGNQIHLLIGHTGPVTAVYSLYSAEGQPFLATSSVDGTVRIWDPISGKMLTLLIIGAPVRDVACLPNSLIAIAMDDGIAVLDANLLTKLKGR
jgi:WD40 repeat protein